MTIHTLFPTPAKSYVMKNRAIVSQMSRFPNHYSGTVIEHDSTSECGIGMDVDLEILRDLALEVVGEDSTTTFPQVVCHAIGLEGVESFEVEKHVREACAGWVAVSYG
mmetsp:Transcript_32192/g.64080  ORF Transcript_32192/g.64080 Transcript_32192/m.64080 type:complete len:108 (-) Transcript_32192:49-372(-)